MNKTAIFLMLIAGVAVFAGDRAAEGQVVYRRGVYGGPWYRPYGYGVYGGWGWNQGSSTVAEGYGRGMADVIRAQGEYNKAEAQARLTREEARAKTIENNKKAADTYWAMRDRYDQRQREEFDRKRKQLEQHSTTREYAQSASTYRGLGPDDFDPVTGKIHWPDVLMQPEFAEYRTKLEQLFEHRKLTGGAAGSDNSQEIRDTAKQMREVLKSQIAKIPADDYIPARKFIDGLAYEGRS